MGVGFGGIGDWTHAPEDPGSRAIAALHWGDDSIPEADHEQRDKTLSVTPIQYMLRISIAQLCTNTP